MSHSLHSVTVRIARTIMQYQYLVVSEMMCRPKIVLFCSFFRLASNLYYFALGIFVILISLMRVALRTGEWHEK